MANKNKLEFASFLLSIQDEKNLTRLIKELSQKERFRIFPSLIFTPFEPLDSWKTQFFEQNQEGYYEVSKFKGKAPELVLREKYPTYNYLILNGNFYFWFDNNDGGITEYYLLKTSEGKLKEKYLFCTAYWSHLITVIGDNFVVKNPEDNQLQLEGPKWDELYKKDEHNILELYLVNYQVPESWEIILDRNDTSRILMINPDLQISSLTVVNDEFKVEVIKQLIPDESYKSLIYMIQVGKENLFICGNNSIYVYDFKDFKLQQVIQVNKDFYIFSITSNLIFVEYKSKTGKFYQKVDNQFFPFETLDLPGKLSEYVILKLPKRQILISKAKELPIDQLPLDLKLEVTEFCVDS